MNRCIDCGKHLNKRGAVRCRHHAQVHSRGQYRRRGNVPGWVSREQVRGAIKAFLGAGGIIQKLPDEVTPRRDLRLMDEGWERVMGCSEG